MKRTSACIFLVAVIVVSSAVLCFRIGFDTDIYRNGYDRIVRKNLSEGYACLFRVPKGYHDFAGPQPLLIFLHGAGEVGTDPRTLESKDPLHFTRAAGFEIPMIVAVPICPEKRWEPRRIVAMLDQLLADNQYRFKIDPDQVYLTGYSMGGFGTFETAAEFPARFAAIVPVAGGGEPTQANKLQNIPTWVFHGEKDKTVPLPSSSLVVDAMKRNGHGNVRLTVLKDAGHGITKQVYSDPKVYDWLLSKRKK